MINIIRELSLIAHIKTMTAAKGTTRLASHVSYLFRYLHGDPTSFPTYTGTQPLSLPVQEPSLSHLILRPSFFPYLHTDPGLFPY